MLKAYGAVKFTIERRISNLPGMLHGVDGERGFAQAPPPVTKKSYNECVHAILEAQDTESPIY